MRPEGCDLLFVILVDTRKESVSYTMRTVPLQVNSRSSRARPGCPDLQSYTKGVPARTP
jgi:hypothetical protein